MERENEINVLEQSLKSKESAPTPSLDTPSSTLPTTPVNGEVNDTSHLSPKTMNHFQELRHSLDSSENGPPVDSEESLDRLNELMR